MDRMNDIKFRTYPTRKEVYAECHRAREAEADLKAEKESYLQLNIALDEENAKLKAQVKDLELYRLKYEWLEDSE